MVGVHFRGFSMALAFPSVEFFRALQAGMSEQAERFKRLGYFDTTFGVRVTSPSDTSQQYVLSFEVFDCIDVREAPDLKACDVDFILEASAGMWAAMFRNIKEHGGADAEHGINTLTHFGDKMRAVYDDPDGHDKMFRFAESIQAFFDLAADLDIRFETADEDRRASA